MKHTTQPSLLAQQHGFTLIEVMITMGILLGIIALTGGMFMSFSQQQSRTQATSILKEQSQTALFRLSGELNQARMLMQEDSLGQTYRANLNLSQAPQPIQANRLDTRLPVIRPEGSLSPEKTCVDSPNSFFRANTVGNTLLFARYIGKFSNFGFVDDLSTQNVNEAVINQRTLDLYDFKYIYLSDDRDRNGNWFIDAGVRPNPDMRRLRLIEWTSVKYVDYEQLSNFLTNAPSNAIRSQIRTALQNAKITVAWRRSGTLYSSGSSSNIFYSVGTGTSTTLSPMSAHQIAQYTAQNLMKYDRDNYSIAYNSQPNRNQPRYFPLMNKTPLYYNEIVPACNGATPLSNSTPASAPTTAKNGYPGGFEVMIVGPASGRNVLLRITSVATSRERLLVDQADGLTAYARDL